MDPNSEELANLIHLLNRLVEEMPQNLDLRYRRADALLQSGFENARRGVTDLIAASKLQPDKVDVLLRVAHILYNIGESNDALEQTRECLRRDQDHKECHKLYKKLKKIAKVYNEMVAASEDGKEQVPVCIEKAKTLLDLEKNVAAIQFQAKEALCNCYAKDSSQAKTIHEAMEFCTDVLNLDPNHLDALINR